MTERDYKAETAKAADAAPNNPAVIAAILQAQALDRLTHEIQRLAQAAESAVAMASQFLQRTK
jgi:hypothetical protein